jgi:hypothetical protein
MTNWKFSWGPFYNIYEPPSSAPVKTTGYGVPVYDPPHGDYYSKPSQPKYVPTSEMAKYVPTSEMAKYAVPCDGLTGAEWTRQVEDRWRGYAAREVERVRHEGNLKRQGYAEPFAVPYYFWLGIDAEHRLW